MGDDFRIYGYSCAGTFQTNEIITHGDTEFNIKADTIVKRLIAPSHG
jgi:hypothetical protein